MLVIGLVSTKAEQKEIRFIAHIWMVRQRIRFLAEQSTTNQCHLKHTTVQQHIDEIKIEKK